MDLIPIANLFVSAISSIATVVQAHSGQNVKSADITKAQQRIDDPLKRGGSKVASVIDNKLLEALAKKAHKEAQELIHNINNQDDVDIIQNHISEANSRVCFYLNKIKNHNENELPTERLKKLWLSHICEDCN
ncbi:hypothetical protein ESZ36_16685 [Colwellia demingiae]|uniref:Uncharacterized protein n=1 Tax=Colwellia demingiae TaxID=89401 RepID=A0A5C6QAQ7_9GAMM|nr:hypothetical protein [Colwellia demingiae]TWX65939.1 hypothetical protein ESZ36_16685 [Colwellia demingiae]